MNAQGMCFVFLVVCALSIRGDDERCFNKEKIEEKYKPVKEQCRADIPKGTEDRKIKIKVCVLKAMELVNDAMELDFDKYKDETMELAEMKKDEITQKLTECWEGAAGEAEEKLKAFYECYKPALAELCPVDSEDWKKCEEEDE